MNAEDMLTGALEAWLWSEQDASDTPLDANYGLSDISEDAKKRWEAEVEKFYTDAGELLEQVEVSAEQIGHTFALLSNGHGVTFAEIVGDIGYELDGKVDGGASFDAIVINGKVEIW